MTTGEPDLAGRTALVTGATRGIGKAVATALSRRGTVVGLVARSSEGLEELARQLGGWALPCDVTDAAAVAALPQRFSEAGGGVPDFVICSAGAFSLGPAHKLSVDDLEEQLAVNLRGSALTVRAFLPEMLDKGSGIVVQVGSVAGRRPLPGNAAYAASKYGLRGYHEVLLEELRGTGVRASLIEPSATDTPLWDPLDPDSDPNLPDRSDMLRPEDVAEAVLFAITRPPGVQIPVLPLERVRAN